MIWTLLPFALVAVMVAVILLASCFLADKPVHVARDKVLITGKLRK
ncbi:MAG: hypothetical protein ACYDIC_00900 [Desulfobaccales bacterium]